MQAKKGDRVKVHYTLKTDNEKTVESSVDAEPLEFTIGEGQIISGFENGVIDMKPGESKTICVTAEQAYGIRDEAKIFEFEKNRAPEGFEPQIGQQVRLHWPDGKPFVVTVIDFTEKGFMMDANHPLAGKDLIFDLEMVEIVT